eukprot:412772-Lingulodinium_polyedra.AAC.1
MASRTEQKLGSVGIAPSAVSRALSCALRSSGLPACWPPWACCSAAAFKEGDGDDADTAHGAG